MPKPKKERLVRFPPPALLFRPIGIPSSHLGQVVLLLDEYEALRLVDHEGMDHSRAADELGISRATCARILESAHKKIADAVVNGCAITIEGGNYRFRGNRYRCMNCGNVWESGLAESRGGKECPVCEQPNVVDLGARVRAGRGRGGRQDGPQQGGPGGRGGRDPGGPQEGGPGSRGHSGKGGPGRAGRHRGGSQSR